jgi:hypothetical protein
MIGVLQDCPKPLLEHCFKKYLWNFVPEPTLIIRDNLRDYSRTALPYRIGVLQDLEIRYSFMIGVLQDWPTSFLDNCFKKNL